MRAPEGARGQGHYVDGPRKNFAGGAGLLSTARDYARFLEMIRRGGALDGVRILAPRTVGLMTTNQIGNLYRTPGLGFGLGFETTDRYGASGLASVGAFGWGGAYGTTYKVDPDARMVFVLMIQLIPNTTDILDKFPNAGLSGADGAGQADLVISLSGGRDPRLRPPNSLAATSGSREVIERSRNWVEEERMKDALRFSRGEAPALRPFVLARSVFALLVMSVSAFAQTTNPPAQPSDWEHPSGPYAVVMEEDATLPDHTVYRPERLDGFPRKTGSRSSPSRGLAATSTARRSAPSSQRLRRTGSWLLRMVLRNQGEAADRAFPGLRRRLTWRRSTGPLPRTAAETARTTSGSTRRRSP